jgi:DNA-binding response OmpR family regulator
MKILIIEDEVKIAKALKRGLEQESFAVDIEFEGESGLAAAQAGEYDLFIFDRMLPGPYDGVDIVEILRKQKNITPIIFLTAKDAVHERVTGLNAGADDYLIKPFAFEELLARVHALLRRPTEELHDTLQYEDLILEPHTRTATRSNTQIELTAKEYSLLEYLMRHKESIVSKESLIEHVWDFDADILPNTVEVYIGYLRAKIERPFGGKKLIHTRRGFGYMLGTKP